MSRVSDTDILAQIEAARHNMCHLAVVEFDGETVRLCDSYRSVIWGGDEYPACGDLVSFEPINESADLQINSIIAGITGVDQTYLSDLLNRNYLDRPIRIYRAYLDDSGDIIGEPVLLFDGLMDEPTIQDSPVDGSFLLGISASSVWRDFDQRNGMRTNNNTHQKIFPGDKGFEFAAQILDQIKWGRK